MHRNNSPVQMPSSTASNAISRDFEDALRHQLGVNFFSQLPASILKLTVREFLDLEVVPWNCNYKITINDNKNGIINGTSLGQGLETPKTATRRSIRQQQSTPSLSTQRPLFPVPSSHYNNALPPYTPTVQSTPRLTIKSSVMKSTNRSRAQNYQYDEAVTASPSKRPTTIAKVKANSRIKGLETTTPRTPRTTTKLRPRQSPQSPTSTDIVQFQLTNGSLVDVDFSRSPQSALQQANLIGSEAIGEVKAKIETYANHFMQYLKFFKKFKPAK